MKRYYSAALAMLVAMAAMITPAHAALRVPQVPVAGGTLQGYLSGTGETINVLTDQQSIQRWKTTISGNSSITLQIELSGNSGNNSIGVYNATAGPVPSLYQIFPGSAPAGWFAVASFRSGGLLVVNLFNQAGVPQSSVSYTGVTTTDFGYYLSGPGGTFYTQDSRQPGTNSAQALIFSGTGDNAGCWWMCFEDSPFATGDRDFDDAVLFLESVNPTPVSQTSWGKVKSLFR